MNGKLNVITKWDLSKDQVGTKWALSRHQVDILHKCLNDSKIVDLMKVTGRLDRTKFRNQVLKPMLEEELIKMTISDKPTGSKQKYRLTQKGKQVLAQIKKKK